MSVTVTVSRTFASESDAAKWLAHANANIALGVTGAKTEAADKPADKPAKTEAAEKPAKAEKAATKKAGITQSQMQAALNEVKEKFDVPTAKGIITEFGGVKKMDEIPEDKYEAVFKACQDKLAAGDDDSDEDDDSGI